MGKNFLLKLCYQGAPIYWRPGSNILEPLLVKNMFFVLFSNMNHGELKVPSPFGRPSSDTQNLVLSELSLFIPPQNIENKILGLQYIGARLQYIGAPKVCFQYPGKERREKVMIKPGFVCHVRVYQMD